MKKLLIFITFTVLMLCMAFSVSADHLYYNDAYHYYDAGEIGLKINGKSVLDLPMAPVIVDDYTMVPVRELFETLGCEVSWNDAACSAEIKGNNTSVVVKIGDRNAYVNGKLVPIAEPQPLPMLIGKDPNLLKTMVPVRFIAQHLGYDVAWDNASRTVLISKKDPDLIIGETDNDDEIIMPDEAGRFGTVVVESDKKYDYIYISTRYGISPEITRFTDPNRIAFDFQDASFVNKAKTIPLNGNCVQSVRYSTHDNMARVVLDLSNNAQTVVMSSDRGILIRAEKSKNEALVYDAFKKSVYFDKAYVGSGKSVTNGYKVTFTNMKLSDQTIDINDGTVSKIKVASTSTGCTVTVEGSSKFTYTAEKGFYLSDAPPVVDNKPQTPVVNTNCIVIDAGHGGNDPGAVGYNSSGKAVAYESHINLAIAKLVGKKLQASGIDVVYTRESDSYVSLKDRVDLSNKLESRIFLSIHCNAIDKADVGGTQVYYHPASEKGTILAENIYDKMVELTGLAPKRTQNGSHLYVIRSTDSPAVLVETAFISNEQDRNYLLSTQGQETIAEAIYQGIMESLSEM